MGEGRLIGVDMGFVGIWRLVPLNDFSRSFFGFAPTSASLITPLTGDHKCICGSVKTKGSYN